MSAMAQDKLSAILPDMRCYKSENASFATYSFEVMWDQHFFHSTFLPKVNDLCHVISECSKWHSLDPHMGILSGVGRLSFLLGYADASNYLLKLLYLFCVNCHGFSTVKLIKI